MDKERYKSWLNYYRKVHGIKNPVEYDEKKTRRLPLEDGVFENFVKDVSSILARSDKYLDDCGITMRAPLWKYKISDTRTWVSSEDFDYSHLL